MPTQNHNTPTNSKTISNNNSQWLLDNQPYLNQPSNHIGFVYLIINHSSDMFYIGKKSFAAKNWQDYTGSSSKLNRDIQQGHLISKHIVHLCQTKAELNYVELYLQVVTNAINDSKYYNEAIITRIKTSKQLQSLNLPSIVHHTQTLIQNQNIPALKITRP